MGGLFSHLRLEWLLGISFVPFGLASCFVFVLELTIVKSDFEGMQKIFVKEGCSNPIPTKLFNLKEEASTCVDNHYNIERLGFRDFGISQLEHPVFRRFGLSAFRRFIVCSFSLLSNGGKGAQKPYEQGYKISGLIGT